MAAALVMAFGYFGYEIFLVGFGGALLTPDPKPDSGGMRRGACDRTLSPDGDDEDEIEFEDGGMKLTILGKYGPYPRRGGATTSYLIECGGEKGCCSMRAAEAFPIAAILCARRS